MAMRAELTEYGFPGTVGSLDAVVVFLTSNGVCTLAAFQVMRVYLLTLCDLGLLSASCIGTCLL